MNATQAYRLDRERLTALADEKAAVYRSAEPFPHIAIDHLFPEDLLDAIIDEMPDPADAGWIRFDRTHEKKLAGKGDSQMGPVTRQLIAELNSSTFLDFLEALTGITGLIPDPHLDGGGLHQILPGGHLNIHVDFNRHKRLKLDRRLNLLLYLNRDWKDAYGGHLELWDRGMKRRVDRIAPVFNRIVVFTTTDYSYHGHPDPLTCPEGMSRKSLALYYFTNGRPAEEVKPGHITQFRFRPGDKVPLALDVVMLKLMPPIILDGLKYLKDRFRK